jgi:type III secretory pathway component EscU
VLPQFQDGTEIHQDVMNLAHPLLLDVMNLAHLLLLDVRQNLDELHQDVNLPFLDAVHLVLVALLGVMVVALVDVALVVVESHQLRMDYYLRVVDVADYLQLGLVPM